MTTDTTPNSSDHASKDVQTTAAEKAPAKDIETKSAIADGNNIDSAEPTAEGSAKSEGEDTKELDDEEEDDEEYDEDGEDGEDEDGEDEDGEDEDGEDEDEPEFEWGGNPRGRITTPITGGKSGVRR